MTVPMVFIAAIVPVTVGAAVMLYADYRLNWKRGEQV